MKVPEDVICKVCKKIFCCAECRYRHELKHHAIIVRPKSIHAKLDNDSGNESSNVTIGKIYLFCSICEAKPLVLHKQMYDEMLEHIKQNHLPLRCRKCEKVYTKVDELKEFSKCLQTSITGIEQENICTSSDQTCDTDISKVTVKKTSDAAVAAAAASKSITISTQTSPMPSHDTPIAIINSRWKARSKITTTHEEFISDSVSSIRNISSISNCSLRRSIDAAILNPRGKLVRSTSVHASTPVQSDLLCPKPKPDHHTFNDASNGQVSSIYNSGCDSDNSPALIIPPIGSPSKQIIENKNRYQKIGGRAKISVTPLRQVMSKSIQKAFAEHGGLPSATRTDAGAGTGKIFWNRKKMFDSTDSSNSCLSTNGTVGSPLDLRLSPAVRRTRSELSFATSGADIITQSTTSAAAAATAISEHQGPSQLHCEVLHSSQKLRTESIVITRTQQHLASVKSSARASNKNHQLIAGQNSSSMATQNSINQSSANNSSALNTSFSNTSSVYQSCRSVEIILATTTTTTTEIESAVNIQPQHQRQQCVVAGATPYSATEEIVDELRRPLQRDGAAQDSLNHNSLAPITPITRIPGAAVINKKLIKFDTTPAPLETKERHHHRLSGASDVFFTPNAATPVERSRPQRCPERYDSYLADNEDSIGDCIGYLQPRSLSNNFPSPKKTSSSLDCKSSKQYRAPSCNRIENVDGDDDTDDDVFISHKKSRETNEKKPQDGGGGGGTAVGRSWSFGSLMSSVMRLPSLKVISRSKDEASENGISNGQSIFERCTTLAGSLVRSKSLTENNEHLKNRKRKRTYTNDNHSTLYLSQLNCSDSSSPTCSDSSRLSSKRFRIQGRKPIGRMRATEIL